MRIDYVLTIIHNWIRVVLKEVEMGKAKHVEIGNIIYGKDHSAGCGE
jgi:hypothetical protein